MFSGKTERKIPRSFGRCLGLPQDWLGTSQVSSQPSMRVLGSVKEIERTNKESCHNFDIRCLQGNLLYSNTFLGCVKQISKVNNFINIIGQISASVLLYQNLVHKYFALDTLLQKL